MGESLGSFGQVVPPREVMMRRSPVTCVVTPLGHDWGAGTK